MFNIGDLVFAKVKGYCFWPAEISDLIPSNGGKRLMYNVLFFGDNTTAQIKETTFAFILKTNLFMENPKPTILEIDVSMKL
jgi:hypothetical protein